MSEEYNLPMVREGFVTRNIKKFFQGFFNRKKKKMDQKRAEYVAQRVKEEVPEDNVMVEGEHQKVDIYEFQTMYRRGEIPIENMNDDQKYALIKLFEMQNERLRESIKEHKNNTEIYNQEVQKLKKELDIIG